MKITLLTGKTFDIAKEVGFELKVINSSRAKRLGLRIDAKNRIPVLTVPKLCSRRQAVEFVKAQKKWIDEHLDKLPQQRQFSDGDKICIGGRELVIRHCQALRSGVREENGELLVSGEQTFLSRRVRDYIKIKAQSFLYELSVKKAAQIGCKVNRVVIKDTKSRWGSCSTLCNINYSWRIMLAPMVVIDYLVAHETAHLLHHNHSQSFWSCVDVLAEDAKFGQNWLKKNAAVLNRYV